MFCFTSLAVSKLAQSCGQVGLRPLFRATPFCFFVPCELVLRVEHLKNKHPISPSFADSMQGRFLLLGSAHILFILEPPGLTCVPCPFIPFSVRPRWSVAVPVSLLPAPCQGFWCSVAFLCHSFLPGAIRCVVFLHHACSSCPSLLSRASNLNLNYGTFPVTFRVTQNRS